MALHRRALLAGSGAALACGLLPSQRREGKRAAARALLLAEQVTPVGLVDAVLRGAVDEAALRYAASKLALTRCIPDGTPPSGSLSHAVLGMRAADDLDPACSPPVRTLLWCTMAWLVAREVARSPYGETPFHLPPPGQAQGSLLTAVREGSISDADAAAVTAAPAELVGAGLEAFGHLGHGALFVEAGLAMAAEHGNLGVRCAARYLASHSRPDDTAERLRSQAGPSMQSVVAAPEADRGHALVDAAAAVVRACPRVDLGNMHLFTMAVALARLAPHLPHAPLVGAAWLDQALEGGSELGLLAHRGTPPGPGHKRQLQVLLGPKPGNFEPAILAALESSRATFHHSVKLAAAGRAFPAGIGLSFDFLAMQIDTPDPQVTEAREALAIPAVDAWTG
jgi:hypothetical protein